jgi:hypothetical protein
VYSPTQWRDHIVEFFNRFRKTDNADGTFDLERVEGDVYQDGTPVSATNLQKMDDEIARSSGLVDEHTLKIFDLDNRLSLIEQSYPDGFTNNLFTDDLITIDSIKLSKGYYNVAQTRIEV